MDKITLCVELETYRLVGRGPPIESMVHCQFSIRYLAAIVITEGSRPTYESYTEKKYKDPKVMELVNKVEVVADPMLPPRLIRMRVITKDGKVYDVALDSYARCLVPNFIGFLRLCLS